MITAPMPEMAAEGQDEGVWRGPMALNATYIALALHPFPAAERYAKRPNRTCLSDCTNISFVQ